MPQFLNLLQHFRSQEGGNIISFPLIMNVAPALDLALERASACCSNKPCLDAVRKSLTDSIEASHDAVRHAHDAWDQLELLNSNMMSITGLVDLPGADDLKVAFKEAKLLTRDRVVWQTMGRFRDVLDMMLSIEYLSDIVKGNTTRISQLRHSYVKIHSDMLVQMMGRYDSWEAFARHLWHNSDDSDVQLVLSQINHFNEAGLQMDSDYQSLMQLPEIVQQAMCKTKTIIYSADQLNDGRNGASSDIASLHRSLERLGRNLSYPDFLDPVQQEINLSMRASLLAVQHAVGAWAVLQNEAQASGIWRKDDGSRKFRKLENLVLNEIILSGCAYLGNGGLADFGFLEHVLRHEISFKGMPRVHMGNFMCSLRTRHSSMQKELLQELICSEKTWARTVKKISQLLMPNNSH